MLPLPQLTSPASTPASTPKCTVPRRHQQYGFSLLELVVVMGILAIFASVSLTFVGEKDVQQRYNESLEKLTMVKRNFLSVDKFQGQMIMHGFFIDNGMIKDSVKDSVMNDDDRIVECVGNGGEIDICKLKVAVSTSFKTLLNLTRLPATPNTPDAPDSRQLKATYKSFSFISEIHINYQDPDPSDADDSIVSDQILVGAGLYKGIRPGAFDLSQYQDVNNEIRDAWGDEFDIESDSNVIQIKDEDYKELYSSKHKVDISYSDLNFYSAALNIYVNNVTENEKFRLAIVSFNNSEACKDDVKGCWSTNLSSPLLSATTATQTIFSLNETSDPYSGASFDHANDLIEEISPNVNDGTEDPSEITELSFIAENKKEWSLTPQPLIASAKFDGNLTVGSHVVVLLELDTNTATATWKIHDSDDTPNNVNHIFEYLHIFPGQTPNPITMSIP